MGDKKLLIGDIETAKFLYSGAAYDRKMYNPYLSSSTITRTRWIPCASWKVHGKNHVNSVSVLDFPKRFKKDYSDDYDVIGTLWETLNNCECFIGHNGENFDWKIIKARFLYHGFTPPDRIKIIDTLKIARSEFRLEANDLRYLCWYLKLPQTKGRAPDWDLVSMGDLKELKYCVQYNKQDTRILEPVFDRLMPFSKQKLYYCDEECPACGSQKYQSKGNHACPPGKWRYQCSVLACSRRWTGRPPKSRKDLNAPRS